MISRVDNVGVAVSQLDRSVSWYEKLGFAVLERDDSTPSATLQAGEVKLWLFQTPGGAGPARVPDLVGNATGLDHLSLWVGEVDRYCIEIRGRSVELETEPDDQTWGFRAASALDPDGTRIFFLGPLAAGRESLTQL
jgi:catechol 2,3-dioxygenase-like lactoylglutathione lyase family enzyme